MSSTRAVERLKRRLRAPKDGPEPGTSVHGVTIGRPPACRIGQRLRERIALALLRIG